jgi:hypothetical protein
MGHATVGRETDEMPASGVAAAGVDYATAVIAVGVASHGSGIGSGAGAERHSNGRRNHCLTHFHFILSIAVDAYGSFTKPASPKRDESNSRRQKHAAIWRRRKLTTA